ncbi:MAG TPA: amidohydrolase family protein [Candidatus Dormibacteraeota bacterium]|nr:amidohydrolase family protein [Candidatus Dormibacteraeota bacterium]
MRIVDSDQHLYEPRNLWLEHIDPALRDEALRIEDDATGTPRLRWRGHELGIAEVQVPGRSAEIGERHRRARAGLPPLERYDEVLPRDYWEPAARAAKLAALGVDEAVLFPNYGLLWERTLHESLPALRANMAAWNRWCAAVAADGGGVLHPVGHCTLRDADWLEQQLAALAAAGVRLAMIAPSLIDGRPLSHPAHDRLWAAFCHHGVTPVFHVADQPRPFADAWYTDQGAAFVPALEAVFLHIPAALGCADLILNGVLERFPALRLGIVELSAMWVPMFLMMLDGAWAFTRQISGLPADSLPLQPSDYFRRQVRVSSFAYEMPARIVEQMGGTDLLMCCSDYPHSEGTASPIADYTAFGLDRGGATAADFFAGNVDFLLHR